MRAGLRQEVVTFIAAAETTNDYNETVEDWGDPTTLATATARVRFGTAQEKREAAREGAFQSATFECLRTPTLDAVPTTARISYDGSQWDIVGRDPLARDEIRFTGVRRL